jgi:hypothetical protein
MGQPSPSPGGQRQDDWYEVRLEGRLDARWAAWFDGLRLSHERGGVTLIQGPIVDQAALHGVLRKVRDLGLPLLSVTRVDPQPQQPPQPPKQAITSDAYADLHQTGPNKETHR